MFLDNLKQIGIKIGRFLSREEGDQEQELAGEQNTQVQIRESNVGRDIKVIGSTSAQSGPRMTIEPISHELSTSDKDVVLVLYGFVANCSWCSWQSEMSISPKHTASNTLGNTPMERDREAKLRLREAFEVHAEQDHYQK